MLSLQITRPLHPRSLTTGRSIANGRIAVACGILVFAGVYLLLLNTLGVFIGVAVGWLVSSFAGWATAKASHWLMQRITQ